MLSKKIIITNETGLHARPASLLVDLANKFKSKIEIIHEDREANVKSIISVMSLAVGYGEEIIIRVDGDDEEDALAEVTKIIESDFVE